MRWTPTKFALWPPGATFSLLQHPNMAGGLPMAGKFVVHMVLLAAGLTFASLSGAGELAAVASLEPATGHWPWIAAAAILGLLGVVSFVSRRRIHSVVGS